MNKLNFCLRNKIEIFFYNYILYNFCAAEFDSDFKKISFVRRLSKSAHEAIKYMYIMYENDILMKM